MKYDYRPFIGVPYAPPTGCFRLVHRVFEDAYGISLPDSDAGLAPGYEARAARFHIELAAHCIEITAPAEGDLIVIGRGGRPWHIGVVVEPGQMLHSYAGGSAVIESYNDVRWRNRIDGFWRYRG